MKQEAVAIYTQNVYSLHRGSTTMDSTRRVENVRPADGGKETTAQKPTQKKLADKEEVAEEVRKGISEFTKEVTKKKVEQEGAPVQQKVKQEGKTQEPTKKPLPPSAYFPEVPAGVATEVEQFCTDASGQILTGLRTEFLTRQYLRLFKKAMETQSGFSFLSEVGEELRQRGVHTNQVVRTAFQEAHVPRIISGGALEDLTEPVTDNETLKTIVTTINASTPDQRKRISYLEKQVERIERNIDEGRVPVEVAMQVLAGLEGWRVEAEAQQATEPRETPFGTYRRRGEEKPMVLTPADAARVSVDYEDEKVRPIALAIRQIIEHPPQEPEGQATNEYLREQITALSNMRQSEGITTRTSEEIGRLMSQIQGLKELLAARENEKRVREQESDWNTYGELRMRAADKQELIRLALDTVHDPEAVRAIEKRFNQIFARADARSSDDWGDAQGTAGQIEVNEFIMTLQNVASGRLTFGNRRLEQEEIDAINEVVRRSTQEEKLRQYLHSITYYANRGFGTEDIAKLAAQFVSIEADLAYKKHGVVEVSHFFEQAMLQVMVKNGGYLPAKTMINTIDGKIGEVEQLVRDQIKEAQKIGILPKNMEDWEINRAISLARGMGIVNGRFFEIVAKSGIPRGAPLTSWWANDVVKNIAFFRQIARYDMGKERNKFLAYKLEGGSGFWSTKELEEIASKGVSEIMDRFVNEDEQNRYIDMINPFQVGSIFTRTGWRYQNDKVNLATAISRLLKDNSTNTLIGVGMWIEKERGKLGSPTPLSPEEQEELSRIFGRPIKTEGDRAEANIRSNLELAAKIAPLKLFYNMMGLRQRVLRGRDNQGRDNKVGVVNPALISMYGEKCVVEDKTTPGQILIKSEDLENDLSKLALLQEKLMKKRSDAYKEYLQKKEAGDTSAQQPDLLSDKEYTTLDYASLEGGEDGEQAGRVRTLAGHIRDEFLNKKDGKPSQMDKLMENLEKKGWKIPFIFGTDDMPYDLYSFTETGSDSFKRRWGDINDVAQAAGLYRKELLMNMGNFTDQASIVRALSAIYYTLSGHDEDVTREAMTRTVEGIIKFYKKDIVARLPLGMGTIIGGLGGKASYAQVAFGRGQMAWDELDVQAFLLEVREKGLINPKQYKELKGKTGARNWQLGAAIARTAIPLAALAFAYYMLQQQLKEKN